MLLKDVGRKMSRSLYVGRERSLLLSANGSDIVRPTDRFFEMI